MSYRLANGAFHSQRQRQAEDEHHRQQQVRNVNPREEHAQRVVPDLVRNRNLADETMVRAPNAFVVVNHCQSVESKERQCNVLCTGNNYAARYIHNNNAISGLRLGAIYAEIETC